MEIVVRWSFPTSWAFSQVRGTRLGDTHGSGTPTERRSGKSGEALDVVHAVCRVEPVFLEPHDRGLALSEPGRDGSHQGGWGWPIGLFQRSQILIFVS